MHRDPLVEAFCEELNQRTPPLLRALSSADEARIGSELSAACARGRAVFGHLALDDETFVKHLARIVGVGDEGLEPLDALAAEDLYLACACLAGTPGAVAAFESRHDVTIRG